MSVPKNIQLQEYQSLLLQLQKGEDVQCKVINGSAEMYGTDLVLNKTYRFTNESRVYIYTYDGCQVELKGKWNEDEVRYVDDKKDQAMKQYVTLSYGFQNRRVAKNAPIIMVVGGTNTGKSTLCRILLNYAVRKHETPIYVELDVGQNDISLQRSIGAAVVNRPADIVNGFEFTKPLVYYFGMISPVGLTIDDEQKDTNFSVYTALMKRLSVAVEMRSEKEKINGKYSGVIINTCGWIDGKGLTAITNAIDYFKVNTVLSFNPALTNTLLEHFSDSNKTLEIVNVLKSRRTFKKEAKEERAKRFHLYFNQSNLREMVKEFEESHIYRYTYSLKSSQIGLQKIEVEDELSSLVNVIAGVSNYPSIEFSDPTQVIDESICGFVYIQKIDTEKSMTTFLVPKWLAFDRPRILFTPTITRLP